MISTESGSIRLFRVAGINVLLHWSWLLVAAWQVSRGRAYSSLLWNVAEYVALFGIVLLHEFGHAFASRQVGGESKEILLWPFGGIAFVRVPPRPGAELWSIAAGPLVNVALWPAMGLFFYLTSAYAWPRMLWDWEFFLQVLPDLSDRQRFIGIIYYINLLLLFFNVLPIYPLDGGQIFRSLLWFLVGRARSLQIAVIVGFAGVGWLLVSAYQNRSLFRGLMALFLAQQCYRGWLHAKALQAFAKMPRHRGIVCPTCKEVPPGGPLWACASCGNRFDPFSTRGICPHCAVPQTNTPCPNCGTAHPLAAWEKG